MLSSIDNKNWGNCQKKKQSRMVNVDCYERIFGQSQIPSDKQYWSMCGKSGQSTRKEEGNLPYLIKGCELDQMLEKEFIVPSQFHGVEIRESIFDANQNVKGVNWYRDDFLLAMRKYDSSQFNPAFINLDTIYMPQKAAAYMGKVLYLLAYRNIRNVMVSLNIVLKCCMSKSHNENEIIKWMYKDHRVRSACKKAEQDGCLIEMFKDKGGDFFVYNGTGRNSGTIMQTIIFYRRQGNVSIL